MLICLVFLFDLFLLFVVQFHKYAVVDFSEFLRRSNTEYMYSTVDFAMLFDFRKAKNNR